MKKYFQVLVLLGLLLIISACSAGTTDSAPSSKSPQESKEESSGIKLTTVYSPSHPLNMEETIAVFFEQQYNAYVQMQYIDLSALVDLSQMRNKNSLIWQETLIQRRKLIAENNFCYVETTKHPYKIIYEKEPRDQRMEFWNKRGLIKEDEITVHFTIQGEKGKVYPPLMAVNAQHTMRLKEIDGVWKIVFHYFPGSTRRFHQSNTLVLPSKEEMLADLKEEFQKSPSDTSQNNSSLPAHAIPYDASRAVEYAKTYAETRNRAFYNIPDWNGNCANFISQSLWFGFSPGIKPDNRQGGNMTSNWYAGQGGGAPAWENVEYFWDYITLLNPLQPGIHGEVVKRISELKEGGVIQLRTGRFRQTDERFNHNLILLDSSTLLFAQNSPDCLVYYSDLVNVDTRFFNPQYLNK